MSDHLMSVYNRAAITVARGSGCRLYDDEGRSFLDCVAGIATDGLGHCHPLLVEALRQQAGELWHVSNIFRIPGQEELARRLTEACFADVAFFGNSGSEAVECALKVARRFHAANGEAHRVDVIGFAGSFHGRTYAAVNASGNPAYLDGFGPRLPGYLQLQLDDLEGIATAIARASTAAVIVEPVQGEGGARALEGAWLRRLRQQCDAAGVLLIYDEVQCGMGRTGRLFAHQWFDGCAPDIMAVAKALGGGFPIGACLASARAAAAMSVGSHGSTFGGNPLAMAVGIAAFDLIADESLLANARAIGQRLAEGLAVLVMRYPDLLVDVRGKGMLIGVKMVPGNRDFMAAAREQGLLVAGGGDNCIRLLPPLNLREHEADEVIERLDATCAIWRQRAAQR